MNQDNQDNDSTRTHVVLTKGTRVDHYTILERIGAGGMGEVYLAEDTNLNRRVALKFMPAVQAADSDLRTRFSREAQASAALSHPNIVHVYEVSEFMGRPYFAMEHIEGKSLYHYSHDDPQPISRILEIAIGICEGLSKAHQLGIVHRDIKSANIILDSDGHPKILDFGLATLEGSGKITKAGSTIGTAAYMSPEQADGKEVDQRSDLFSFGVVLYELIAGRTPFKRDSEMAMLKAITSDIPEPLARFKSDVPDGLQVIVDKALEKDPRLRYQSAADMLADLLREKRFMDSGVSAPSRISSGIGSAKSSSVFKLAVSGGVIAVLVIIALVLKPWKFEITPSDEAHAAENRMAVMYFDNLLDPSDSLRTGEIVTNLLITNLAESKDLMVLSSQRLYDILKQLGKEDVRSIDRETATQIAERARAQWMMTGTILQTKPKLVMTTQVIDVKTGQIEASLRSTGNPGEDIFSQVDRLSSAIRGEMSVEVKPASRTGESSSMFSTNSEEAYRLYLEGIELGNKLYNVEARKKFRAALRIDSTFAMAYFQLGKYGREERYAKKALKYIDHASPLQRRYIAALAKDLANNSDGAISELLGIIKDYPDEIEAYKGLANIYGNVLGEHDKDKSCLLKAIEIDPNDKTLYNSLAYAYKAVGKSDSAILALDKYIALAPEEANPYDSRGEILAFAGRIDEAIVSYRKALEKDPKFYGALFALGKLSLFKEDIKTADSALRILARVEDLDQRSIARVNLAVIPLYQGKLNEAIQMLKDGMAADRLERKGSWTYALKFLVMGFILETKEKYSESLEYTLRGDSIFRSVKDDEIYGFLPFYIATLARSGQIEKAYAELKKLKDTILASGKELKRFYYSTLAEIDLAKGDLNSSIANFKKTLEVAGIKSADERYPYSRALVANGDYDEAIKQLTIVLTRVESIRDPIIYTVWAHDLLGQAYEGKGETKKAIKEYETFLRIWKDADPDIPMLIKCKERLARLRS